MCLFVLGIEGALLDAPAERPALVEAEPMRLSELDWASPADREGETVPTATAHSARRECPAQPSREHSVCLCVCCLGKAVG